MSERTVYMVTAGEYSDYQVLAIYDNREAAEAHVLAHNGPEEEYHGYGAATVEEMPLCSEYAPEGGVRGAYWATWWDGAAKVHVSWRPRLNDNEPSSGAVVRSRQGEPLSVTGYGRTGEHAKRAWYEAKRGVDAGTIVVDSDGKLIVPLPDTGDNT